MAKLVRYETGEIRVEDREVMRCSEWLPFVDPETPYEDYNLDYEIGEDEPTGTEV